MAGGADPPYGPPDGTPDGTPEGLPGRDEDQDRPVVFDESFIRAARLQELSAHERMGDDTPAVRRRPGAEANDPGPVPDLDAEYEYAYDLHHRHHWRSSRRRSRGRRRRAGAARHAIGSRVGALILVLLVATVFAVAIHLGSRYPYQPPPDARAAPLRITLVALAPTGPVSGGRPADLFARSPAAQYRPGAAGITLPPVRRTAHFTEGQVMAALDTAKAFLVRSALDPDTVTGGSTRPVRLLVDPDQFTQFDRSVESPSADGRHATSGWLIRFDPARVALADPGIRVRGTLQAAEASADVLQVTADHTYTYALRPAGPDAGPDAARDRASLFTVRREVRFHFDRDDLRMRRAELVTSHVQAGPVDCAADLSGALRPLLAGERPTSTTPPTADPFAGTPAAATPLCATLPTGAAPPQPQGRGATEP
ncbi:SCO2583 family membrane protein [Streptomyces fradiae]|uniref:SCO2583 family membrane protein n=1 Tax=Streptomyces fradiae TaxID=1906 RepID=UPI0037F4B51C